MLPLDILPRLIQDSYVVTWREAFEEASRRKASAIAPDAVTRIVKSPYGGYRVYTVSMTLAMELFADFAESGVMPKAAPPDALPYGEVVS